MSTGGRAVPCDLVCELRIQAKTHQARVRTCSLSRCFVQTDLVLPAGTMLELQVARPSGAPSGPIQAVVQRAQHERWLGEEQARGLDIRLIEVGPTFFSIYAALCEEAAPEEPPSLSLLSAAGRTPGRSGRERRGSSRACIELPVRVFGCDLNLLGATRDLSPGGAFIECDTPLRTGERVHLEFLAPRSFYAEGHVVRSEVSSDPPHAVCGFGVRFASIDELIQTWSAGDPRTGEAALAIRLKDADELGWLYREQVKKGALFVPGRHELAQNALVDVIIQIGDEQHTVKGRVLRVFDEPEGVGLQIVNREALAAWCQARMRG